MFWCVHWLLSQEPAGPRRIPIWATLGSFLHEGVSSWRSPTQQLQHHGQCHKGIHRRQHSTDRPICGGQLLQTSGGYQKHGSSGPANKYWALWHQSYLNLSSQGSNIHPEIHSWPSVEWTNSVHRDVSPPVPQTENPGPSVSIEVSADFTVNTLHKAHF